MFQEIKIKLRSELIRDTQLLSVSSVSTQSSVKNFSSIKNKNFLLSERYQVVISMKAVILKNNNNISKLIYIFRIFQVNRLLQPSEWN